MTDAHTQTVCAELGIGPQQVSATAALLEDGGTVPFIARYRKEVTGSLDEVAITAIRDRLAQLEELDKRRQSILNTLEETEQLTDELRGAVQAAETMSALEDVYLPYRPKRRTRATVARERGLEPLAEKLFVQGEMDVEEEAASLVDDEEGLATVDDVLSGARDIVAEWISENPGAREEMRSLFGTAGQVASRVVPGKEEEGAKYRDYFAWEEPLSSAPSHRVLAMRRGEAEGFLSLRISPPEERAHALLEQRFVKGDGPASQQVRVALEDSYKRLLGPSMETETRLEAKVRADAEAVRIFSENLRQLLLASPLGQRNVLAIDPGFRTGCKLVCLDRQGGLLHTDTIYPGQGQRRSEEAGRVLRECIADHSVEAIAIGNGTGGRELERFVHSLDLPGSIPVVMVNESGASVYSASPAARDEFPDLDLTVRGAISIGRRLMDPLAELVKIDPKAIGVGQYQHDVDQSGLRQALDDTVVSCVNAVGVEVNTASQQLLTYVSGLGPQLAKNLVEFRDQNGPFSERGDLKNVPRLGPKAFEQAAGFLRIRGAEHPLDASAVHPESYSVVDRIARDLECELADVVGRDDLDARVDLDRYVSESVGLPTLKDILSELAKPGRDPREQFEAVRFEEAVQNLEDLKSGMVLPGVVTNITAFGAFVDVGVHQDGLVHISQLADRFVKDPSEVVKVQQKVTVTVLEVDLERKRISLSMRERPLERSKEARGKGPRRDAKSAPRRQPSKQRGGDRQTRQPTANTALAEALRKAGVK